MNTYSFYVGSTDTHDAHSGYRGDLARMLAQLADAPRVTNLWGVWDDEVERVARYDVTLADDATALRVAYALTVLTGNECVMVTRDALPVQDGFTMSSARAYRVTREIRYSGNRTLMDETGPLAAGWALTRDVTGGTVAYLVWSDAHVSPVA